MPQLSTILQVVSDVSLELGTTQLPVTQAVGSSDQDVAQMVALMANVADELLLDPPYRDALGDGNWIYDTGNLVRKSRLTQDTDVVLFDQRLAVDGYRRTFCPSRNTKVQAVFLRSRCSQFEVYVAFERIFRFLAQQDVVSSPSPVHSRRNIQVDVEVTRIVEIDSDAVVHSDLR